MREKENVDKGSNTCVMVKDGRNACADNKIKISTAREQLRLFLHVS